MFHIYPPPPPERQSLDALQYGVAGDGVTDDTAALQALFNRAIAKGIGVFLPTATYKISNTLFWNDPNPKIQGQGEQTVIMADGTDYNWLECGNGLLGKIGSAGWIRNLYLRSQSQSPAPAGFKAGLVLSACWNVELRDVWVDDAPVGFDFINNSMLTKCYNLRTAFGRCRIGVRLSGDRPGMVFASGSDQNFHSCDFWGRDAAVWMERSGGGYNFHGGQIGSGAGLGAPDDSLGSVMINKNLEDANRGGRMSARFFGTSFESASNMWNVRVHDLGQDPNGCQLLFAGVSFTGGVGGDAIGVLKLTDGYNDTIEWHSCTLNGEYSNAVPLSIAISGNGAARPQFVEFGTQNFATFNGVMPAAEPSINTTNMLAVSNVQRGFGSTAFHILIPGMILHGTDTVLQYSKNIVSPSWTNV